MKPTNPQGSRWQTVALSIVAASLPWLACASKPVPIEVIIDPPSTTTQWDHDWAREAVFYEVFVRSFADSNGDGIGDLAGLTAKLDLLNDGDPATHTDLGVDALWLMPIFESPSYHGYDTVDYERIESDYGTEADFDRFLVEAHRRGIKVVLDFVMNHTSSDHPWFVDSASGPASPHRDWYVWRADDPGWTQPWGNGPSWHPYPPGGTARAYYYGIFWGGMPDLSFANPAVRGEIERLGRKWLARGVDGFRLDATRHLFANGPGDLQNDQPETHDFLREFAKAVREAKPGAMLVGENWTDSAHIAEYYGSTDTIRGGDELPMSFDFPLASAIVDGVGAGQAAGIASALERVAALYPPGVLDATFLTNHDMARVATQLGNGGDEVREARLRAAAAVLLTLPGVPFLYYGEEVGLANGPTGDDPDKRTPMPWDATRGGGFTTGTPWRPFAPGRETANVAAQTGRPGSLLDRYRTLIGLRHGVPALASGSLRLLATGSEPGADGLLTFVRQGADQRVLVVHNLGATPVRWVTMELSAKRLEPLFTDPGVELSGEADLWQAELPAGSTGIWLVD
jgi:glycosidase